MKQGLRLASFGRRRDKDIMFWHKALTVFPLLMCINCWSQDIPDTLIKRAEELIRVGTSDDFDIRKNASKDLQKLMNDDSRFIGEWRNWYQIQLESFRVGNPNSFALLQGVKLLQPVIYMNKDTPGEIKFELVAPTSQKSDMFYISTTKITKAMFQYYHKRYDMKIPLDCEIGSTSVNFLISQLSSNWKDYSFFELSEASRPRMAEWTSACSEIPSLNEVGTVSLLSENEKTASLGTKSLLPVSEETIFVSRKKPNATITYVIVLKPNS